MPFKNVGDTIKFHSNIHSCISKATSRRNNLGLGNQAYAEGYVVRNQEKEEQGVA